MGKVSKLIKNYDKEGNLISKECSKCHKIKLIEEFNKDNRAKDKRMSKCKECEKQYRKTNKERIDNYNKEYYESHSETIKEYKKEYRVNNEDKIKKYLINNSEKIKKRYKEYYKKNIKKYKKYAEDHKKHKAYTNKQWYSKQVQEALQEIKIEVEASPEKYNYIEGKDIYGIIYLVHNNESDKYYVGQSINSFDIRYKKGWLKDSSHSKKDTVKEDLQLYGEESFEYIKIFKVAYSQYELDKLEAYYIDYYNSYENGYNENRGNIFTNRGKKDEDIE